MSNSCLFAVLCVVAVLVASPALAIATTFFGPALPLSSAPTYRAAFSRAVVQRDVNTSLALFATHAAQAGMAGADFIIFGEFTLFTPESRAQTLDICTRNRNIVLAKTRAFVLQAKLHFAMINFCDYDSNTNKLWNANFVVGPAGVLAVYRKSHVWLTRVFDTPAQPDLVVVKGALPSLPVRFGCFMCYDILFPTPGPELRKQGISHFLYNAHIPILGSAAFRVWSLRWNATLLAADADNGGAYVRGVRMATPFKDIFVANVTATE